MSDKIEKIDNALKKLLNGDPCDDKDFCNDYYADLGFGNDLEKFNVWYREGFSIMKEIQSLKEQLKREQDEKDKYYRENLLLAAMIKRERDCVNQMENLIHRVPMASPEMRPTDKGAINKATRLARETQAKRSEG